MKRWTIKEWREYLESWLGIAAVVAVLCLPGCGNCNATYGRDSRDWGAPLLDQVLLDKDKADERMARNNATPPKDMIDYMTR